MQQQFNTIHILMTHHQQFRYNHNVLIYSSSLESTGLLTHMALAEDPPAHLLDIDVDEPYYVDECLNEVGDCFCLAYRDKISMD